MKKIRLHWNDWDNKQTWEDITVSENATTEDIEKCIKIALRTREDEVNQFIKIMNKKGFEAKIFREVIEVYDFN